MARSSVWIAAHSRAPPSTKPGQEEQTQQPRAALLLTCMQLVLGQRLLVWRHQLLRLLGVVPLLRAGRLSCAQGPVLCFQYGQHLTELRPVCG